MIISNNKKYRDDFVAIVNYIRDCQQPINMYDFMEFVVSYEYYKVFYQNYHIVKDLIDYHDTHLGITTENEYVNDPTLDDLLKF